MGTMRRNSKLMPREERFVEEYLADGEMNATAAYRRAYPKATYGTARTNSAKLLARADIRTMIRAGRRRLARKAEIDALRVIRELALVAFADIGDVIDFARADRPRVRSVIPASARKAIAAVKIKRLPNPPGAELVEFKLYDKLAALEKLGKHLGLFGDLPPLEVLLAALPPDLASCVRQALADKLHAGGGGGGGGGCGDDAGGDCR